MKPGMEKENFVRMLTEMTHCLEDTEMNLQESVQIVREKMYRDHLVHLESTSMLLDKLEGKIQQPIPFPSETIHGQATIKLEISC